MRSTPIAVLFSFIVSAAIGNVVANASQHPLAGKRKPLAPRTVARRAAPIPVTAGITPERKQLSSSLGEPSTNKTDAGPKGPPTELRLTRGASKKFDLRKLPATPPRRRERPEREAPPMSPAAVDTDSMLLAPGALFTPVRSAVSPVPLASFEGLDFDNWGTGHPPDTVGDVGREYYVQAINSSIGIYRKSDGVRVAAFTFDTFMSQGNFGNLCDTDNMGDPVVLYDTFEDRWIITDFAFTLDGSGNVINPPGAFQCFAASMTGDPVTGGWHFYSINTAGGLGDYPKFGIWPDGLYMSANMFGFGAADPFQNPRVYAFNKAQMYAGSPSVQVVSFNAPSNDFTILPSNARLQAGTPPTGTPNFFVSTWRYTNALGVYKFHVDWSNVSLSTFAGPDTPVATNSWPNASVPNAETPGNSLDVLQIRAMMQNQYTNIGGAESLWATHTVRRGDTTGFAAPRWYQVNVTGGTVNSSLPQAMTWDPDASNVTYRYVPSLAVDRAGNMAVAYTASNSTTNPAIKYAGRLSTDPAGTFSQTEQVLIQGNGTQTGNCGGSACARWGDYSGMTLDPDGCRFWLTSQYYAANGLSYLTRIGSFQYSQCTAVGAGGTINGTVTAASGGAPISGATVQFGARSTTTNGSGAYSFTNIPAGTYPAITATAGGYVASTTLSIVVTDGGTTVRDFSLTATPASACLTDTSQADFQSGVPNSLDLTSSPGNVTLPAVAVLDQQQTSFVGGTTYSMSSTIWVAQTFEPAVSGPLVSAELNMWCLSCTGTTPDITISIRATSSGAPTGVDLASATLPGFSSGSQAWHAVTFSSPVTVTAGTRYALVAIPVSNPSAGLGYGASRSSSGAAYANGSGYQYNSGTWYLQVNDLAFKVFINAGYSPSGDLTSSLKDSNPASGVIPLWSNLSWNGSMPANTTLRLQVAGSSSASGPFNFVGPDGSGGTFFTSSPASLSQFHGSRYLQYKAYLSTSNSTVAPILNDVTVCYANQANLAPVLTAIGNKTVAEGTVLATVITATDPDGDTVTYSSTALPSGASFNTSTGAFSWTPTTGQAGVYPVTFTASDAFGGSASEAITISVTGITPSSVVATPLSATSVDVVWVASTGAVSYEILRRSTGGGFVTVGTSTSLGFVDSPASANTAYLYAVRGINGLGSPSAISAPDLATTTMFTDDPIVAGATPVRASHVDQLRMAINAVRALAGVGSVTFTDASLSDVFVKKVHIDEMRAALDAARGTLGLPIASYTDPTITANATAVKAVHVTELRNGVK